MDGVSTYLALTFGTLLSSQGPDASFVLTLSGFPPGASLRCFRLYQILPIRFPRCLSGFRLRDSLSGAPDFIRDSESDFPPPPGGCLRRTRWPGARSGGVVNVLERGGSMQIEPPRFQFAPCRRTDGPSGGAQTSTTTGRIMGRRR